MSHFGPPLGLYIVPHIDPGVNSPRGFGDTQVVVVLWVGIRSCHTHKMHAKTTTHDRGTDGHGVDGRVNGT